MASLKTKLSQHSREELARNIDTEWFKELLEVLRYTGSFADRQYSEKRAISELEHQALNGSYRQGFVTSVEYIVILAQDPKEDPKPVPAQFGSLVPLTSNPKEYPRI